MVKKILGRRKHKNLPLLILETTVEAYSRKIFLSLAKEPDKTPCVPDMSRCVCPSLCWEIIKSFDENFKEYGVSLALFNLTIPGKHGTDF